MVLDTRDFFAEYGEANRYSIREVIGKGSYGVVCSAVDQFTGERVAIKKITNVFEHVSDATRILREIKLLRLLKHPDIVEIKHIMLPPSSRDFKDIYVVFELMETDLHQVIKANDDLTPEHHQFFLYQMLRGLKYIHSAKVFHRDLKPKNILANSDCKLKICDFGLARPAFNDMPTTIFWTDYVATRWYRAPELCGSFYAKYSPAIDIWSVGCIFAEVLLGKPLFPGRNVVHQLELITDLLGTPSPEVIAKVRNEKARRFLAAMRRKPGIPFEHHFPRADPGALALLRRLLAFDPSDRPTAEEALADPYFQGLHCVAREPIAAPISKLAFEFDRRKLTMDDVRELIYREVLEYHPQVLSAYLGNSSRSAFVNPSALDNFKRQFAHLEANPGSRLEDVRSAVSNPNYNRAGGLGFGGSGGAASAAQALREEMSRKHPAGAEYEDGERVTAPAAQPNVAQRQRYLHSQTSAPMPKVDGDELRQLVERAHKEANNGGRPSRQESSEFKVIGSSNSVTATTTLPTVGKQDIGMPAPRMSAMGAHPRTSHSGAASQQAVAEAYMVHRGSQSGAGAAVVRQRASQSGTSGTGVSASPERDSSRVSSSTSVNGRVFSTSSSTASTTATVAINDPSGAVKAKAAPAVASYHPEQAAMARS